MTYPSRNVSTTFDLVSTKRQKHKSEFNKKPLIRAPLWAAITAYTTLKVVRHSNGQLMQCVTAGTSGASEPTFSATALMSADGTCAWAALGRNSCVNSDGYEVPTVTFSGTAPAGSSLLPFLTTQVAGPITEFTATAAGSGYVNGTYTNVPMTTSGNGTGGVFTQIVVSGGAIASVKFNQSGTGTGYKRNETVSCLNTFLGGSGSGFSYTIRSVINDINTGLTELDSIKQIVSADVYVTGFLFNTGEASNANNQGARTFEFYTDDPKPGLRFNASATQPLVFVDGYRLEESITPLQSVEPEYYIIDWNGARKMRKYTVKFSLVTGFRGINILPQSVLVPVYESRLKGAYFGDSYNNTISNYFIADSSWALTNELFFRLGILSCRNYAVSGTGYLTGKTANDGNISSTRYSTVAVMDNNDLTGAEDAILVVFANGLNDVGGTVATIVANAIYCWNKAAVTYPNAVISIFGPWSENSGPSAAVLSLDTALKAAFDSWGYSKAYYHSIVQDATYGAWTSGTGIWGTTTGTGNSDFYTGADGTHPSFPGRSYLVDKLVAQIEADLTLFGY